MIWATPGQLDAGFASLATFGAGVYAVRALSIENLGAYALLFSAFQVVNQVSTELVFIPSQILAVQTKGRERLGMLRHSLPRGGLLAVISGLAVPLGAIPIRSHVLPADLVALATSAALLAILSPVQDHARSMLHMAKSSWIAASVSAIHLATTVVALFALARQSPLWSPFGALAAGNVVSLLWFGIWFRRSSIAHIPRPTFRELTNLGGWLLTTGLAKTGLGYASRALLSVIVGITALGFIEGGRVVAHPINVFALGLMAQVGPRLTEFGAAANADGAKRWRRRYYVLLGAGAIPYIAITATSWDLNPLASLIPRAYEMPGLTAAMLLAVTVGCLLRPLRIELLGAKLPQVVAQTTMSTGLVDLAVVFTGLAIGAFAAPLAIAVAAVVGVIWFKRRLDRYYEGGRTQADAAVPVWSIESETEGQE